MASRKDPLQLVNEARTRLDAAKTGYKSAVRFARSEGHTVRRIAWAAGVTPQEISRLTASHDPGAARVS